MRRVIPILLAILVVLTVGETPSAVGQDASPTPSSPGWASLGLVSDVGVTGLAVAPDWPRDPVMVAVRPYDIVRSLDAGRTWEVATRNDRLPLRSPRHLPLVTGDLTVVRGASGLVVFLAVSEDVTTIGPWSLLRSEDLGTTWERTVTLGQRTDGPHLILSQTFEADGGGVLHAGYIASVTADGGRSWEHIDHGANQYVRQVVLSPSFAADRTIFLSVSRTDEDMTRRDYDALPPNDVDNRTSAGILVSNDGGHHWTQATQGLEVDGVPYRIVRSLSVSPTYGEDGMLMAVGAGPLEMFGFTRLRRSALFRSVDRGASWTLVYQPLASTANIDGSGRGPYQFRGGVSFSPQVVDDGEVFFTLETQHQNHNRRSCHLLRTRDFGRTWMPLSAAFEYEEAACVPAQAIGSAPTDLLLHSWLLSGVRAWVVSEDGGDNWTVIATPSREMASSGYLVHSPSKSLFAFGNRGVWVHRLSGTGND